jgi:hypothetical protein
MVTGHYKFDHHCLLDDRLGIMLLAAYLGQKWLSSPYTDREPSVTLL